MTSLIIPYFFIIHKGPFAQLHDLLLLQVLLFLNNGPFIVYYDKNTKLLAVTIDKYLPNLSKTLLYKQLHTPYFHTLTVGNKKRIIIQINPHNKGLINELIWYDLDRDTIIHQQCDTDSRRKALITRWNNRDKLRLRLRLRLRLQQLLPPTTPRTNTNISRLDYIKNTSFKSPQLARSCIIHS
jgi:hypothetical protein